jgi:hypothetical protein
MFHHNDQARGRLKESKMLASSYKLSAIRYESYVWAAKELCSKVKRVLLQTFSLPMEKEVVEKEFAHGSLTDCPRVGIAYDLLIIGRDRAKRHIGSALPVLGEVSQN